MTSIYIYLLLFHGKKINLKIKKNLKKAIFSAECKKLHQNIKLKLKL